MHLQALSGISAVPSMFAKGQCSVAGISPQVFECFEIQRVLNFSSVSMEKCQSVPQPWLGVELRK